jgi:hypothetical protein
MKVFLLIILFPAFCYSYTDVQVLRQAQTHLPQLDSLITQHWPDNNCRAFIAGQIEQETCASLKKCWNSTTELKTEREYGFGLGQITVAFNKDGSERFNSFVEAKKKYKELLGAWKWEDRYNVTAQLTYIVLECKTSFVKWRNSFDSDVQTFAAVFVSYNAGAGTVLKRKALCQLTDGCNTASWFGGLASVHLKTEEVLLYGKELYKRRNEYPQNIIAVRSKKYEPYFKQ